MSRKTEQTATSKLIVNRNASEKSLQYVNVANVSGAERFLFLFDGNDDNDVSKVLLAPPLQVDPKGSNGYSFEEDEKLSFQKKLVIASSTTQATYTAAGGADFIVMYQLDS